MLYCYVFRFLSPEVYLQRSDDSGRMNFRLDYLLQERGTLITFYALLKNFQLVLALKFT